ncbi:hypothetical protein EON65_23980 [archaeon]|nr:MAG: hypothetical protein EON65_23980 [archaeon]
MGIRNGYLLLITSMTVCQIIYDINFIQGVIPGYVNCVIWNVFDILGGLSVALWSNVISYVAMHVIVNVRSMSIYENYPKFFCFAMIPSVVLSMASIAVIAPPPDDDAPFLYCEYRDTYFARAIYALYFWGRIFSILFNFGVFAYISYRIHRMMKLVQSNDDENKLQRTVTANPISPLHSTVTADSSNVNTTNTILHTTQHNIGSYPINATTQCIAIVALVSRMKYYPLAQAISRSGAAWNEFLYYSYDSYPSHMMAAICSPVLGILNFLIFLVKYHTLYYDVTIQLAVIFM